MCCMIPTVKGPLSLGMARRLQAHNDLGAGCACSAGVRCRALYLPRPLLGRATLDRRDGHTCP